MANYVLTNGSTTGGGTQQATATTYVLSLVGLNAPTSVPRRGKLYDILIGTNAAPADNFLEFDISRITTSSTSTLLSGVALDPADAASTTVGTVNSTAAATLSVPALFYLGMNQRASYRWVCAPGSEIVWPATASNGICMRARSGAYTGTATATWMYQEQ